VRSLTTERISAALDDRFGLIAGRRRGAGLRRVPELPRFVWYVTNRTKSPC
jgi:predicted ATPase